MAPVPALISLEPATHELLIHAAERQGIEPHALANELLRTALAGLSDADLEATLAVAAKVRAGLPSIDAVALVRAGRTALEQRGG